MPPPRFTAASLREALGVAGYAEGQRVEFAAIRKRNAEHAKSLIETRWVAVEDRPLASVARWLCRKAAAGRDLYFLANPLRPEARKGRAGRAWDRDCLAREVLLLDVDPDKEKAEGPDYDPAGTRPEKLLAAAEIALEVQAFLRKKLGVRAPLVSSGRGRQLWLRIKGDHTTELRSRLIAGLKDRFDREGLAGFDRATRNAARLMRLPGGTNSVTCQRAEILDPGDGRQAPADKVKALADELAPPPPEREPRDTGDWDRLNPSEQSARLKGALDHVPADDYGQWIEVGFALAASGLPDAYELWDAWSSTAGSYQGQAETAAKWATFSKDGGKVTLGTVYHLAKEGGWVPPALPDRIAKLLPLAETAAPPRKVTDRAHALELARTVLREPKERQRVVQDRRPTGAGKTTDTAREIVAAARDGVGRYLWAAPHHAHARLEVLPALARAGAVVWDEDLDGNGTEESPGVRARLEAMGARILPIGEKPDDGAPVACKVPVFDCPGPKVKGWTSESVNQLYAEVASRGWNAATTVCRACPRFMDSGDARCSYWERRQDVTKADLFVVPHHALKKGSGASAGRRALVIDEDPSGALIENRGATRREIEAFRALLEAARDSTAAEVQRQREKLELLLAPKPDPNPDAPKQTPIWEEIQEQELEAIDVERDLEAAKIRAKIEAGEESFAEVEARADAAELALNALDDLLAGWEVEKRAGGSDFRLDPVYSLERPEGELSPLLEPKPLQVACERVLRELGKKGERLEDASGKTVGAVRNLIPLVARLVETWIRVGPVVAHVVSGSGKGSRSAAVPIVMELPDLPTLALDATGDPRLLELATRRPVELIEGELTARLHGIHLAGVPVSRKRWSGTRTDRPGRGRAKGAALAHDLDVIVRHLRRVGAKRVGLVSFKNYVEQLAAELQQRAGVEVRCLHYGAARGSNLFEDWADAMVLAGTPYVDPSDLRLRAALEGASVEELLDAGEWEPRRLPGGGACKSLRFRGAAVKRAYTALVHAALEQALGRAGRGEWSPEHGVLVLSEPWPTRHRLHVTTREREALAGAGAVLAELVGQHVRGLEVAVRHVDRLDVPLGDPQPLAQAQEVRDAAAEHGPEVGVLSRVLGALRSRVRLVDPSQVLAALIGGLVAFHGGADVVAERLRVTPRTARRWVSGERFPEPKHLPPLLEQRPNPPSQEASMPDPDSSPPPSSPPAGPAPLHEQALAKAGTTRKLAEAIDVDVKTVRRWMRGVVEPGERGTQVLRAFLGLEPEPETLDEAIAANTVSRALEACGSVKALARELGVAPVTVRRWRSLERSPAPEHLEVLERLAQLPPAPEPSTDPAVALPGDEIEGVGMVYAETGPGTILVAGPKRTPHEQFQRWVDPSRHPGWLCRASRKARGLPSLATMLGATRSSGRVVVDENLALKRVLELQEGELPLAVRRYLGEVARLLAKRGAKVDDPRKAQRRTRAAREAGSAKLAAHPLVGLAKEELGARLVKR